MCGNNTNTRCLKAGLPDIYGNNNNIPPKLTKKELDRISWNAQRTTAADRVRRSWKNAILNSLIAGRLQRRQAANDLQRYKMYHNSLKYDHSSEMTR